MEKQLNSSDIISQDFHHCRFFKSCQNSQFWTLSHTCVILSDLNAWTCALQPIFALAKKNIALANTCNAFILRSKGKFHTSCSSCLWSRWQCWERMRCLFRFMWCHPHLTIILCCTVVWAKACGLEHKTSLVIIVHFLVHSVSSTVCCGVLVGAVSRYCYFWNRLFGPSQPWQVFVQCVLANTSQHHDTVHFMRDLETEDPQFVAVSTSTSLVVFNSVFICVTSDLAQHSWLIESSSKRSYASILAVKFTQKSHMVAEQVLDVLVPWIVKYRRWYTKTESCSGLWNWSSTVRKPTELTSPRRRRTWQPWWRPMQRSWRCWQTRHRWSNRRRAEPRQTDSLFQESTSASSQTSTDFEGVKVVTMVRLLAAQEESAALAQLTARISGTIHIRAGEGFGHELDQPVAGWEFVSGQTESVLQWGNVERHGKEGRSQSRHLEVVIITWNSCLQIWHTWWWDLCASVRVGCTVKQTTADGHHVRSGTFGK